MSCKIIVSIIGVALLAAPPITSTDSEVYLDRVLKHYRDVVMKTGQRRIPADISASLIPRPKGFEEPKNWTTDSALRLLHLLKQNKKASSVQKALSKVFDASVAAGSSEIKLRGMEEQPVVTIDNHLRANLPSATVDLKTIVDLLLPMQILSWLSSVGLGKAQSAKGLKSFDGRGAGGAGGFWGGGDGGGWGGGAGGGWGGGGGGGGPFGRPGRPGGWYSGRPGRPSRPRRPGDGGGPGEPGVPGYGWYGSDSDWDVWSGGRPGDGGGPGQPGRPGYGWYESDFDWDRWFSGRPGRPGRPSRPGDGGGPGEPGRPGR